MPLQTLQDVPSQALKRDFVIEYGHVEVTSIDIASHGGYCVAACSNGAVVLFDLTRPAAQTNGYLIAHIQPKGMHTTLRFTVKITEDSRFCFAGVRKGSSDLVAVDLARFNLNWNEIPNQSFKPPRGRKSTSQSTLASDDFLLPAFDVYTCNDAKLRGFGAVVAKPRHSESHTDRNMAFWLACGMGIKNVHVWELVIENDDEDIVNLKRDRWTCIYDIATNGSSITHLGFRLGTCELISKCDKMNIRVWDLGSYFNDPQQRPSYEDIPNTHDIKCLTEYSALVFGGVFDFAMVNIDKSVPREANRSVLELPEKGGNTNYEDDPVNRRRRAMREIDDIVSTQDGAHVLILCADGQVLHHYRDVAQTSQENSGTDHASRLSKTSERLQEFASLQRDHDNDQLYLLRRIGSQGVVVLIRVQYCNCLSSQPCLPPLSRSSSANAGSGSIGNGSASTNSAVLGVAAVPTTSGPKKLKTKISISVLSEFSKKASWSALMSASEVEESMDAVPHTHWHSSGQYFRHPSVTVEASQQENIVETSSTAGCQAALEQVSGASDDLSSASNEKSGGQSPSLDEATALSLHQAMSTPSTGAKKSLTGSGRPPMSASNSIGVSTPRQSDVTHIKLDSGGSLEQRAALLTTPVNEAAVKKNSSDSVGSIGTARYSAMKASPTDENNKMLRNNLQSGASTPILSSLHSTPEPSKVSRLAIDSSRAKSSHGIAGLSSDGDSAKSTNNSTSSNVVSTSAVSSSYKRPTNSQSSKARSVATSQPQQTQQQQLQEDSVESASADLESTKKRKAIVVEIGPCPVAKRTKESFAVIPAAKDCTLDSALRDSLELCFTRWKSSTELVLLSNCKLEQVHGMLTSTGMAGRPHTRQALRSVEIEQEQCLRRFVHEVEVFWHAELSAVAQSFSSSKRWPRLSLAVQSLRAKFNDVLLPRHKADLIGAVNRDNISSLSLIQGSCSKQPHFLMADVTVPAFHSLLETSNVLAEEISLV